MISNEWFEEQDIKEEGSNVADAQYFVMEEMLEERRMS